MGAGSQPRFTLAISAVVLDSILGISQAGILLGSNDNLPASRRVEGRPAR